MRISRLLTTALAAIVVVAGHCAAQTPSITIDVAHPGVRLSPMQHGVFFEEINHAGEGGVSGEMLINANFDDGAVGWAATSNGAVIASHRRALTFTVKTTGGRAGVVNFGHYGLGVHRGERLVCEIEIKSVTAGRVNSVPARVTLIDRGGIELARQDLTLRTGETARCGLTPNRTVPDGSLAITIDRPASVTLSLVSLRRAAGFANRPGGLRPDLADLVANVKPSFMRFPGGCYVEGDKLADRFQWKRTIGGPEARVSHADLWGYRSSNMLGYHEYLQWCEDMHAEPLFVVNCGMSHTDIVPMEQMNEYVQDALDAIEYANGDTSTHWGTERALDGHPKPYNLRCMEIGNENSGPAYEARYALFWDAIKAKYPYMTLIANTPVRSRPMDMIDEHYYSSTKFFARQSTRYDSYPRNGPKIYVGEYAVTVGCGNGNLNAALGEAFFITGMERNADVVRMASYAPLFVNVNDRKWNPDAIVFNTLGSFGTPSYWVQQMFSTNRGDVTLPTRVNAPVTVERDHGGVGVGTWRTEAEYKDLKVTHDGVTLWTGEAPAFPLRPERGAWNVKGGDFTQSSREENCRAIGGDPSWTDYTFTLKARKRAGAEGFLILFHTLDDTHWRWWNIGGWGNTRSNVQVGADGTEELVGRDTPGTIETGRWYDVRLEVAGGHVRCFLDNELIQEADVPTGSGPTLGVVTTREDRTGDILIKVVNIDSEAAAMRIVLTGARFVRPIGSALTLTSSSPNDENSFEEPRKVAPVTSVVRGLSSKFESAFPPYSVTILRIHAGKR